MGLVIPTGFGLASWHTLTALDAEEMVWTCGFDLTNANDIPNIPTLMAGVWSDHLQDLTSTIVTLTRTVLKVGPSSTGPTYEAFPNTAGTDGGALLPPNCAVLVRKLTALGGRKGRGRAYVPGISEISGSLDSSGTFSTAEATVIDTAFAGLDADLLADTTFGPVQTVLLHSDSTVPTFISGWATSNKIATQRRRLRP